MNNYLWGILLVNGERRACHFCFLSNSKGIVVVYPIVGLLRWLDMNIISTLNNREIATAIWLMIALLWVLSIRDLRSSIYDLLKNLFCKIILVPLMVMLLYIFFMIIFFKKVGFWDVSATKDTVIWILGTAFIAFINLSKAAENENYFKNMISDNIKLNLIFEFVFNLYSFNLVFELMSLPIVIFTGVVNGIIESKPEFKQLKKVFNNVLGLYGLLLITFTFRELIVDFQNFATFKNLRDFLLPPLFSIVLLPFVYFMALYLQYNSLFTRVDHANKNSNLAKYTKRKILVACHVNLSKLKKFSRNAGYARVNSKDDVLAWVTSTGSKKTINTTATSTILATPTITQSPEIFIFNCPECVNSDGSILPITLWETPDDIGSTGGEVTHGDRCKLLDRRTSNAGIDKVLIECPSGRGWTRAEALIKP